MIVAEADLPKIRSMHQGQKIVFAGGTFDILHHGHMDFLRAGRSKGDIFVMSIASDAEVRARKGPTRPLHSQGERAHTIDKTGLADYVVIRSEITGLTDSMMHTARLLQPDVLLYGPDVPHDVLAECRRELGYDRVHVDTQPKVTSTTSIIRRMQGLPA